MGEEVSYHIVHLHHLGHLDQLDGMYVSNAYVGFYVCMSVCISVWRRWSRRPSNLRWSRPREEEDKEEEEQEEGRRRPPALPFSSTSISSSYSSTYEKETYMITNMNMT